MLEMLDKYKALYQADDVATGAGAEASDPEESKADETVEFDPEKFKKDPNFQKFQSDVGSKAAETARKNMERVLDERLAAERKRWEEESKLTQEEKEANQRKEYEKQLTEKEQSLKRRELELDAVKMLSEEGLSASRLKQVIGSNQEETLQNIKDFKSAVQEEAERLDKEAKAASAKAPKSGEEANPTDDLYQSKPPTIQITRK